MKKSLHSSFAPSAAYRWFECPGSIRLCQGIESETSVYAEEGTAAHEVCEIALCTGGSALDYVGMTTGNGWTVTKEMAEYCQVYVDFIRSIAPPERVAKGEIDIYKEYKLELKSIPGVYGTIDFIAAYHTTKGALVIVDFKYGKGVEVEVAGNKQLLIYLLAAFECIDMHKHPETLRAVIVQPRVSTAPKEVYYTQGELLTFREELKSAVQCCKEPDAPLVAGNHCRWCPALQAGKCHEVTDKAVEVTGGNIENCTLPDVQSLDNEQLSKIMRFSEMLSKWCYAVAANATSRMMHGEDIPGYKLVRKRANRKYKDEAEAEKALVSVLGEKAYNKKLLTPAQAEKKAGKKVVEKLTEKPAGDITIAPENDRRRAIDSKAVLCEEFNLKTENRKVEK